jgi:hypothetical protein
LIREDGVPIEDDFAKELAKQLPVKEVYKDAVSPAAKQAGQLMTDIIKTIQLALAPLQFLGAYQDRLRRFIDRSVRRVPTKNRISPAPQILGPVIEGVRYETEGTPIDKMFSELLSNAMDQEKVHLAHPSFPYLIRQLSSDEARLLELMAINGGYRFVRKHRHEGGLSFPDVIEIDELPRDDLAFPENVSFYMDHLNQLGLAGVFQVGTQEPLYEGSKQWGVRITAAYRLTDMGVRFMKACMPAL